MTANASSVKSAARIGPKKCGLLIFPGRLPQAPSGRQISSTAIIAHRLRHKRHSVPPKESNACFNFARGCLPQSLHSPQFQSLTRFTLIYPSCSVFLFGNDRANFGIGPRRLLFLRIPVVISRRVCARTDTSLTKLYTFRTNHTVRLNEYRSVYGSALMNSSTSPAVL